jgi:hypothetical protein
VADATETSDFFAELLAANALGELEAREMAPAPAPVAAEPPTYQCLHCYHTTRDERLAGTAVVGRSTRRRAGSVTYYGECYSCSGDRRVERRFIKLP